MQIEVTNEVSPGWWESDDPDAKLAPKSPPSPTKRRAGAALPEFEFPIRSPSTLSPSLFDDNASSNFSKSPSKPRGSFISSNSATDVDSLSPSNSENLDDSFWATSAALLGPDFDFTSRALVERVEAARSSRDEKFRNIAVFNENSSNSGPAIPPELLISLESLGMSWKWFTDPNHVQTYVSNRVPANESWDFGICFSHPDGRIQCLVMHAQGEQRLYSEPSAFGGAQLDFTTIAPNCTPVFWWCRPHPQWSEANRTRWAQARKMDTSYAFAKRNILAFKLADNAETRFALRQSRQDLLRYLQAREHTTGKYSVGTMNTVLQLSSIAELLSFLSESERWAAELVKRRTVRVGANNEHTCAARYKHAQLLLRMQLYEDAKNVAAANAEGMLDLPPSHILVVKHAILTCAIACKRKRLDQALEVVEHLWTVEQYHSGNREIKELGLRVLVEVYTLRNQYDRVEEYLRKQIALYDEDYGSKPSLGYLYFSLATTLSNQHKLADASRELRKAQALYKELGLAVQDEEVIQVNVLLGDVLSGMKEWTKAKLCLGNARKGALLAYGNEDDRFKAAVEKIAHMDRTKKGTGGLADRLVRHREKEREKDLKVLWE